MDIISIGEPLMELSDVYVDGQRLYLPGFGGDTSNFIISAARQGAGTAYYSRLGLDSFGDSFMKLWENEGVDVSSVQRDKDAHTGLYFITYGENGHEFTYMRKGSAASRMTPEDIPEDLIKSCKLFHVSGISQAISDTACDAVFRAISVVKENGVLVSSDPNLRLKLWGKDRAAAVIHATAAMCDVFLPSYSDVTVLTGLDDPDGILEFYHKLGAKLIVMKMGDEGAMVSYEGKKSVFPCYHVDTVDCAGAGDTFDGAFCARWLAGDSPEDAAKYANIAAALSTRGKGAVAPIPTKDEVAPYLS